MFSFLQNIAFYRSEKSSTHDFSITSNFRRCPCKQFCSNLEPQPRLCHQHVIRLDFGGRRQSTCWDPPWTRRTTAYQHSSSYELDMYSPSPPRRRPTCWDPPVYRETPRQRPQSPTCCDYRVQQGYQAYDRQHPTLGPLKFNDRFSELATLGDGESESIYYPDDYWESDEYEEDVDVSSMGGFLANELAYPRDIVKRKGQGKGSVPATKSRFSLGVFQPLNQDLVLGSRSIARRHFDDSRQPLRLNLPSSMKQNWERNPRRLSRPYLRRDPSSSSPPQ